MLNLPPSPAEHGGWRFSGGRAHVVRHSGVAHDEKEELPECLVLFSVLERSERLFRKNWMIKKVLAFSFVYQKDLALELRETGRSRDQQSRVR